MSILELILLRCVDSSSLYATDAYYYFVNYLKNFSIEYFAK